MLICVHICICERVCVGGVRVTEKRATCADRGLHQCPRFLAGAGVSLSGRSAVETAPANTQQETQNSHMLSQRPLHLIT